MKLRLPLLILGAAVILQIVFVPYLAIQWFKPELPLLVVLFIASRRGAFEGVLVGFGAGLLVDAMSTSFFGLSCMSYSIAGFLVGKLFYLDVSLPLQRWAFASGAGIVAHGLIFSYFYSLNTAPSFLTMLFTHVFPASFYTWALGMVWAISPLYDRRDKVKI